MYHRIDIKVGYNCNNHCQFCVQGDKRLELGDKDSAEILSILEKRRKDNEEVVFTGGEVTIRRDFFDWVSYAKQLNYKAIQIQSNGRMFAYVDFCEKAVKAGANIFALAVHGSRKEIHDSLTNAPGSFDQVVQGIKNLKAMKQRVLMNTVVNKINYKDLPAIAGLFVHLGVDQFQFAFMHINNQIKGDTGLVKKIVARKSDVIDYVKKGLQIGIDNDIRVMTEAIPYCFMEGYEKYVAERSIPHTSVEAESFVDNFDKYRKEEGKVLGSRCKECRYVKDCEGPWKEYPEIFGWSEFVPVKK